MMEQYAWWKSARSGTVGPISVDDPMPGFYRVSKFKGGPLLPLAIFPNEHSEIVGHFDGRDIDRDRVNELWPFAARNHVDEAAWREVAENGGKWPDIDEAVHNGRGIGDNSGALDEAEAIKAQIENASAGVKEYAVISDDATRDRAQTLRSRLLELSGEADKRRESLKKPHFEAAKAVDTKWQPLVKAAKAAADTIRAALSAWETKKFQAQQASQRAEMLIADAIGTPSPIPAAPIPTPTKFKGGAGRSASTSVVKTIKAVTDWPALYAHFANDETVRAFVLDLARKAVKAGYTVPGVEIQDAVDVK